MLEYLFLLFCACFGFIALNLLTERGVVGKGRAYSVGLALFGLLLWQVHSHPTVHEMFCLAIASVLLMFVAPYLTKSAENDQMWTFCYRLSLRIAFTFLAAVVLYVGIFIVITTVNALLFKISHDSNVYLYLWLLVAGFFSPLLAMAGIPRNFDDAEEIYPKFIKILLGYIVLPIWVVYIIVLYLYMAKIAVTQSLPNGQVAYLVSFFGIVTVGIYLKGYPIFKQASSGLSRLFSRFGFALLVAPLILLALAIFTRISAYGVTDERYLIVLCLIWLSSAIAIRFFDDAKAPRRILLSGIALLVLATFGPWGMDSVSAHSQFARLTGILEKNHILVDGKIVKAQNVPFKDAAQISDSIDYLVDSKRLSMFRPWFVGNAESPLLCKVDCAQRDSYDYKKDVKERLGKAFSIEYLTKWERKEEPKPPIETIRYSFDSPSNLYNVKGYDLTIPLRLYSNFYYTLPGNADPNTGTIHVLTHKATLTCSTGNDNVDNITFDVVEFIKTLKRDGRKLEPDHTGHLVMNAENEKYDVRLYIKKLEAFSGEDCGMGVNSLEGLLAIKQRHD